MIRDTDIKALQSSLDNGTPLPAERRRVLRNDESRMQIELVRWWDEFCFSFGYEPHDLFSIPNGGFRTERTASRLKREGARAGVPDLFLACPIKRFSGMFLELKLPNGKISSSQSAFCIRLLRLGYHHKFVFSLREAQAEIQAYLK